MSTWWIPPTLRGYRLAWLGADALAGLALVAVVLPSQMATALLADLSPVTGLYAFVAGSLVYAAIGKSHHLSVGADSTIAPVLAVGVASVAVVGSAGYTTAMALTALLVGGLLVLFGLFRMGWIAEFLSTPVITGVLAGIAVVIIARQIPLILGVPSTGQTTVDRLRGVVDQLGNVNGWSLAIGIGVLCLIGAAQKIDHRLPGTLIALIVSALVVNAFGLASHHGVAVVGHVQPGLPDVRVPSLSLSQLRKLPGTVLTVVFLCIAQTAATVRNVGDRTPATGDFNRELIAVGGGSIAAGFIGALAVDTSPPNTAILRSSGARSQLANIVAVVVVVVVLVGLTARLAYVPEAMLGATLIFIATKLFRMGELRRILRFRPRRVRIGCCQPGRRGRPRDRAGGVAGHRPFAGRPDPAGSQAAGGRPRPRAAQRPLDTGGYRPDHGAGSGNSRLPGLRPYLVRQRRLSPVPDPRSCRWFASTIARGGARCGRHL